MPNYRVQADYTTKISVVIQADDEDQARQAFEELTIMDLGDYVQDEEHDVWAINTTQDDAQIEAEG